MIRTFLLGVALAVASFAAPVQLASIAGLDVDVHTGGGAYVSDTTEEIEKHPAWAPELNGAQWISYAQTGYTPGTAVAPNTSNALFRVYQNFTLQHGGVLNLTVWADDTAAVYLNDELLPSLFPQPNLGQNTCAPNSIGCQPGEEGSFANIALGAGNYSLRFDVYQVGTSTNQLENPTGLLYTGSVSDVPEPGTWAMIAGGLTLLVGSRRFARR